MNVDVEGGEVRSWPKVGIVRGNDTAHIYAWVYRQGWVEYLGGHKFNFGRGKPVMGNAERSPNVGNGKQRPDVDNAAHRVRVVQVRG